MEKKKFAGSLRVKEIQQDIRVLTAKRDSLDDKIDSLKEELLSICQHPNPETKTRYESGSYFDRSHTYEYLQCPICGIKSEEVLIHTGSYE